jgi:hypothetical protein
MMKSQLEESAPAINAERCELVAKLQRNEGRISEIVREITKSKARHSRGGNGFSFKMWQELESERVNLIADNRVISERLKNLKKLRTARNDSFAQIFLDVAKEVLAGPIFDRIKAETARRYVGKTREDD